MSLLNIEGITTSPRHGCGLNNINLELDIGEVIGILGPKGSGKRQLLELIAGIRRPLRGAIGFSGLDVTGLSSVRRARLGLASNLETESIVARLVDAIKVPTLGQRLRRSLHIGAEHRLERREQDQRIAEILSRFGLNYAVDRPTHSLSAGERHRAEWARLLVRRPKLLVVDEPFRGAEFIAESASLLFRDIAREGVGIVLSQRDLHGVDGYDRVYVLDDGEVIAHGPPHEVCRRLDVLKLFASQTKQIYGANTAHPWRDASRRATTSGHRTIFISYTRQDAPWVARLEAHLRPLVEPCGWRIWTDRQIEPGSDWMKEIERAMAVASAAILLVSPTYLSSTFVAEQELPTLTAAARLGRLKLLWLPLHPTTGSRSTLDEFQALLDPRTPLASSSPQEQEQLLEVVVRHVMKFARESNVDRCSQAS